MRSDGTYVRDYLYVKDAVSAYPALAGAVDRDEIRGEAFNLSTKSWGTVIEIVETVRKLMQSDLEQQAAYRRAGGRFIVPLPEPRMI